MWIELSKSQTATRWAITTQLQRFILENFEVSIIVDKYVYFKLFLKHKSTIHYYLTSSLREESLDESVGKMLRPLKQTQIGIECVRELLGIDT